MTRSISDLAGLVWGYQARSCWSAAPPT